MVVSISYILYLNLKNPAQNEGLLFRRKLRHEQKQLIF